MSKPMPQDWTPVKLCYSAVNRIPWNELVAELKTPYVKPLTVHLPIQPVGSPDFIHVDCALNAILRRVYPKMSVRDPDRIKKADETPGWLVQFALDNPPFMPDMRRTRLSLAEGRYPVVQAEYFALDLRYRFEYSCMPTEDEQQHLLCIRVQVRNTGYLPWKAHVRSKVNIQRECDISDYHYTPFYWDNTKWKPCDLIRMEADQLLTPAGQVGRVIAEGFDYGWEESAQFEETDFNKKFRFDRPYYVPSTYRLTRMDHVVHFEKNLNPGEEAAFTLMLLTNLESVSGGNRELLNRMPSELPRTLAVEHFRAQRPGRHARLVCPTERWGDLFEALQTSSLQLMVRFPGEQSLMPTQGGSSERAFVWVWEAVWMLLPLVKLGYEQPIRQALDYIFSLQDGGYPPHGDLKSLDGAIGTTGPRWLCTTGAAIALASDYYLYTHDEAFLRDFLPRMRRAVNWIAGEVRATRKLNPDGTRPAWYGLMPFGCGTDGDIGYVVAFTDAYTYWGLEKWARLLTSIRDPHAREFEQFMKEYRADLDQAISMLSQPSGRIERAIRTGRKDEHLAHKFEHVVNASHLAFCGLLPVDSPVFLKFMAYMETDVADGLFMAKMDQDVMYTGINETIWQDLYLQLGEWKKAFAAVCTNLRHGMTQDTFQVQERFSLTTPEFTPWQPNGSGNGRALMMVVKSFYFEHQGVVTLLGNYPFAWLRKNGRTSLSDLRTSQGWVSLEVRVDDTGSGRLLLVAEPASAMPEHLRFPGHLLAQPVSNSVTALSTDRFAIQHGVTSVEFILHEQG
jgi:hypothetical protein